MSELEQQKTRARNFVDDIAQNFEREDWDEIENLRQCLAPVEGDTPTHDWTEDPHGDRYDCKRSDLYMGELTDDALANACYICNHRTSLDSINYLVAVKDRIRWLSRQLIIAEKKEPVAYLGQSNAVGQDEMVRNKNI